MSKIDFNRTLRVNPALTMKQGSVVNIVSSTDDVKEVRSIKQPLLHDHPGCSLEVAYLRERVCIKSLCMKQSHLL